MEEGRITEYTDVFYGNGETDRFFDDGLSSKWFYIKALCGNTTPAATLPFGKMSVCAYSGGYPTGYGTHYPNSCGRVRKFSDVHRARGFSHIHQSGTGGIRYYYNYAIVSPFYGDLRGAFDYREIVDERARPGFYSARLGDTECAVTVDGGVAIHSYRFARNDGRISVDFSNDGLLKQFGERFYSYVGEPRLQVIENGVLCSGIFSGIRLYFAVAADSPSSVTLYADGKEGITDALSVSDNTKPFGAIFDNKTKEVTIRVAYSTEGEEPALEALRSSVASFDEASMAALGIWEEALSHFLVEGDDGLKRKFYSALYHSIVKPTYLGGERIGGVKKAVEGIATAWDQYKTALPLVYLSYPEMAARIAASLINTSRSRSYIPCSAGLTDILSCEEQARCLGVLTLTDAYRLGASGVAREDIEECMKRELERDDVKAIEEGMLPQRYTHVLDVADAALAVADITDDADFRARLVSLAEKAALAYAPDGLLSERSVYYEGDRYTYSFRLHHDMDKRIALAGGKARFCELLDGFFGFGRESVKPIFDSDAYELFERAGHHRFQGFNNECDMEAPYAYIFADRHDRLCEIMHECVSRSFGTGRSALPGNNDSGGLSSLFVFAALGIFPATGRSEFLIGSPAFDRAVISLADGNRLEIVAHGRLGGKNIYVDKVLFNSVPIDNYRIDFTEISRGGVLEIYMKQPMEEI